ncbi:MAG: hypothetical protein IJ746_03210 [Ruminococcus sp.]|nr:hypothetical protein [Ruminococcus sp.]
MLDLLHSDLRRFFRSKILYVTIALCAFIGWFTSDQAREYGNSDSVFMLGFLMVQAGGFSLIIGSEFSCKAVRNKLIAGYTKVQIYFSMLLVTLIVSLLTYAGYILPLLSLHNVVEYTGVTPADVIEIFACILAVNVTMNLITVAVSFVFSARAAISAVLAIVASIGVSFVGSVARDMLSRPQYWQSSYQPEEYETYKDEDWLRGKDYTIETYGEDGNGEPIYEYVFKEPNEDYIERGTPLFYCLRTADLLCPFNMLNHIDQESGDFLMIYDKWGYGSMSDADLREIGPTLYYKRPWDLEKKLVSYLILSVAVTAVGCFIFRKRDMR